MKSLTVRLPEPLLVSIEAEARERQMTKSDVVRLRLEKTPVATPATAMWDAVGDILEEGWRAETPDESRVYRSPHKQKLAEAIRAKKQHCR